MLRWRCYDSSLNETFTPICEETIMQSDPHLTDFQIGLCNHERCRTYFMRGQRRCAYFSSHMAGPHETFSGCQFPNHPCFVQFDLGGDNTPEAIEDLSRLNQLTSLTMNAGDAQDETLGAISRLTNLKVLEVYSWCFQFSLQRISFSSHSNVFLSKLSLWLGNARLCPWPQHMSRSYIQHDDIVSNQFTRVICTACHKTTLWHVQGSMTQVLPVKHLYCTIYEVHTKTSVILGSL